MKQKQKMCKGIANDIIYHVHMGFSGRERKKMQWIFIAFNFFFLFAFRFEYAWSEDPLFQSNKIYRI